MLVAIIYYVVCYDSHKLAYRLMLLSFCELLSCHVLSMAMVCYGVAGMVPVFLASKMGSHIGACSGDGCSMYGHGGASMYLLMLMA